MNNIIRFLGVIAMVAIIGFSMSSCNKDNEDKSITISNIDTDYNGKFAFITLVSSNKNIAYSMGTISNGSFTNDLLDWETDKAWKKSGSYMVILIIYESAQAVSSKITLWEGATTNNKNFTEESTTVPFTQFIKTGPEDE